MANPYSKLQNAIGSYLEARGVNQLESLIKEIPKKWEKFGDTVLFGENCFKNIAWNDCFKDNEFCAMICQILRVSRIAKQGCISNNDFRSPKVILLHGSDPWVQHKDNNVKITWNIQHSMFSAGNITEKIRLSKLDCSSEVIVDLFAGIGYFTLQFLVHARAKHVHACEWNPYAVEALRRNLAANKVEDKCTIYVGDNREVCPKNIADRVNLGLIPSSEISWPVACHALNQDRGGILHIHANMTSKLAKNSPKSEQECSKIPAERVNEEVFGSADLPVICDDVTCQKVEKSDVESDCVRIKYKHVEWRDWAVETRNKIRRILEEDGREWKVDILHVEHVKSYAPRIDHLVLDLKCSPIPK